MNHGSHQAQHATGALKFEQRAPILIEAIENFGMDRISFLDPPLVLRLASVRGEILRVLPVEISKGRSCHIPVFVESFVGNRLKRDGGERSRSLPPQWRESTNYPADQSHCAGDQVLPARACHPLPRHPPVNAASYWRCRLPEG